MTFFKHMLYLAIATGCSRVILPPVKDKATAVRTANYLRQWGLKCRLKQEPLGICFWVEVEI